MMKFISLFAGIGGLDLGLERSGMECVAQVEIDDFCQKILTKHWPDVPKFKDVRDVGKHNLPAADLICGGFPCQPHSYAGKRRGKADDRNLWPEYFRIVREIEPRYIIGENVPGLITSMLDEILSDLESIGYTCQTFVIPALAFNAPHKRDRVYVVAYSNSLGYFHGKSEIIATEVGEYAQRDASAMGINAPNSNGAGLQRRENSRGIGGSWQINNELLGRYIDWDENWVEVATRLCGMDDGIPRRVDRLKSLGNAVVPQVAEFVGNCIMDFECQQ